MSTIVAFHAHPDDEALLTGGTLARLAAEGHRTVIVVACDGVMGEATGEEATRRLDELRASARVLGAARTAHLGYADSGHGPLFFPDPADRVRFARAPLEQAAARLAEILHEESADVLLSYDPNGGYGHRDHVRVHEVAARAAELAGVRRVLQATAPREPIARAVNALRLLGLLRRYDPAAIATAYSPRAAITHRVDVRRFAGAKRAALACHVSQVRGPGRAALPLRLLVRLPSPVFGLLLGREWYVDPGAVAGGFIRDTIV
ncbi:PIG-L family deacetylase [Actinocrinis puniceicyclus]|uniref:PIG-L family deacetylase n=1 Tax=Actinocrinis puniceicyclus TaxID=977794 RepID=A0A8J7WRS7_9ACTN|nr:PIG-L family deacetylase [Actinocrinis puniceicyclus]MBS2965277.1 PIG-L family deacetylase [Actinocrinis puniceicyclus]